MNQGIILERTAAATAVVVLIPLGNRIMSERTAAAKAVKEELVLAQQVGVVVGGVRARHRARQWAGLALLEKEPSDLTLAILARRQ